MGINQLLAFGFAPGPMEMLIIGLVALLLFGKRLPEVAKSLGKGIVEFKRGVHGIEDEVEGAVHNPQPSSRPVPEDEDDEAEEMAAPKFEPPKSEPSEAGTREADEQTSEQKQQS